jgi:hypothetical protein
MPGDERLGIYGRASQKIRKYWAAGELPASAIYCAG